MHREIDEVTPIGQIAAAYPDLIPELDRLGIDYCCGGGRRLREVAAGIGLNPQTLVRHLVKFEPEEIGEHAIDCSAMSMTALADHIEETHHVFTRDALTRLEDLLRKCVAAHSETDPRLLELQATVATLADDMHDHLVREERVLFPWLRRLERRTGIDTGPPWSVRRPIDCMIHDHEEVRAAFNRIHELTDDLSAPEGACPTWRECYRLLDEFERDTRLHIHKENNILFPAGVEAEKGLEGRKNARRQAARVGR